MNCANTSSKSPRFSCSPSTLVSQALPLAVGSVTHAQILVEAFQQAATNLSAPLYTFVEDYALGPGFQLASAGTKVFASIVRVIHEIPSR